MKDRNHSNVTKTNNHFRLKTKTKSKTAAKINTGMEHRAIQEANADAEAPELSGTEFTGAKEEILTAISSLKSEFSNRLEEILTAVEETRKDLTDCTERITQAEVRLSTVEDEHAELQETVKTLKKKNKFWKIKSSTWKQGCG